MGLLEYINSIVDLDLDRAISRRLLFLVKESVSFNEVDYSQADIIWMKNLVLDDLKKQGVTRENFNPAKKDHRRKLRILEYKWLNTIYNKDVESTYN